MNLNVLQPRYTVWVIEYMVLICGNSLQEATYCFIMKMPQSFKRKNLTGLNRGRHHWAGLGHFCIPDLTVPKAVFDLSMTSY